MDVALHDQHWRGLGFTRGPEALTVVCASIRSLVYVRIDRYAAARDQTVDELLCWGKWWLTNSG